MTRLALAALVWAALLGCGPAAARDRVLTIGLTQYPSTLHPSFEMMLSKAFVLGLTRRPLTAYDGDWRLVCLLCTELPTPENGRARVETRPDGSRGLALRFTLPPGAAWGDGTPLTSEDVAFTVEVGRHPQSGFGNAELYRRIRSVEIEDARSFVLHLDQAGGAPAALPIEVLPAHLERARFADAAAYRRATTFETDPTHPGLHFGPYRITEVARGSHVVLERNPTWWGRPGAFERIVVKVVQSTPALEADLLAGGIDLIPGEAGIAAEEAAALAPRLRRHRVAVTPGLLYEHIDVNLDDPVLADPRMRRALLLGIDRASLSREILAGQPVAHGPVSPAAPEYATDLPPHPYAPDRAAALLEEAGWRRGPDGLRRDPSGRPLRLELLTTAGNRSRELVAQAIQAQWRVIGVDLRLRAEPPRTFFGESLARRRFDDLAMFAWATAPGQVPRIMLHSDQIPAPDNNWAGQNAPGYRSAAMDRLIEVLETEAEPARRQALWRDLQRLYAEDLPALPLYFRHQAQVLPDWLDGFTPTGHQFPSSLWVETWRTTP